MRLWLCIASDYQHIHAALCKENTVIKQFSIDKKFGNQQLLLTIDKLLKEQNIQLKEIAFIGINLGPAPYTSLRIALTTVNGLHAASDIPLVGIDALHSFIETYHPTEQKKLTVALLNAFNYDVFYAIARNESTQTSTGYAHYKKILEEIKEQHPNEKITFVGNGVSLYFDTIHELFGTNAHMAEPMQDYPTIDQLVESAWKNWQQGHTIQMAEPRYLKQVTYKNSIKVK